MTNEQKVSLTQALGKFAKFLKENDDPVPASIAEQAALDIENDVVETIEFANALFEKSKGTVSVNALAGYLTGVFTTIYAESLQQSIDEISTLGIH